MSRRLWIWAIIGALAIAVSALALAAGEQGKAQKRQGVLGWITPSLGLTEDQQTQLKPAADKLDATMADLQAKMKAARQEFETELDKVLTPEQKQKRDEMRKQHEQRPGGPGGPPPAHHEGAPPAPPQG